MNKAYIAGFGILCPLGAGWEEVRASLDEGESGIEQSEEYGIICGDISGFFDLTEYTETKYHYIDKVSAYTIAVIKNAMTESGFNSAEYDMYKAGLVLGTEWGCTATMEMFQDKLLASDPKFATPFLFSNSFPNSPSGLASIEFGIKGYNTVYSGSDTSGLFAVTGGIDAVQQGKADTVFAVGADALSRTTADFYGDGVSDGAACLVLTKDNTGVAVQSYSFTGREPQRADAVYTVKGNRIIGPDGKEMGFGMTMGAAFPIAVSLAYESVKNGNAGSGLAACSSPSGSGWIRLEAS